MISVSLPFNELAEGVGLGSDTFLSELYGRGVRSIELRPVIADFAPEAVLAAASRAWAQGLRVSVHSAPFTVESAVRDIFTPLRDYLRASEQECTTLVLHPVKGEDLVEDNRRMMHELTDYVRINRLPVRFALENNRKMPDKSAGDSVELVKKVITEIDPEYAGLTFDFGHYAWYTKVWETERPVLPPKEFTERAVHTHIHALSGPEKDYTTHFPLQAGTLPLREYIDALGDRYPGVYNIELEPRRFAEQMSGGEGILGSVEVLKRELAKISPDA